MFRVRKVITGPLQENCYIVFDEKKSECVVIDPGDEGEKIEKEILSISRNATLRYILLTHCHFDHIGALRYLKKNLGGEILMHRNELGLLENANLVASYFGFQIDEPPPPDKFIDDGEEITLWDNVFVRAIYVPGHSPGGMAYLFVVQEKEKREYHLFTGDILFAGSVGRTDLPGGNWDALITGIKAKLLTLPPDTIVYPGHGPETTIAREKLTNPFLIYY